MGVEELENEIIEIGRMGEAIALLPIWGGKNSALWENFSASLDKLGLGPNGNDEERDSRVCASQMGLMKDASVNASLFIEP